MGKITKNTLLDNFQKEIAKIIETEKKTDFEGREPALLQDSKDNFNAQLANMQLVFDFTKNLIGIFQSALEATVKSYLVLTEVDATSDAEKQVQKTILKIKEFYQKLFVDASNEIFSGNNVTTNYFVNVKRQSTRCLQVFSEHIGLCEFNCQLSKILSEANNLARNYLPYSDSTEYKELAKTIKSINKQISSNSATFDQNLNLQGIQFSKFEKSIEKDKEENEKAINEFTAKITLLKKSLQDLRKKTIQNNVALITSLSEKIEKTKNKLRDFPNLDDIQRIDDSKKKLNDARIKKESLVECLKIYGNENVREYIDSLENNQPEIDRLEKSAECMPKKEVCTKANGFLQSLGTKGHKKDVLQSFLNSLLNLDSPKRDEKAELIKNQSAITELNVEIDELDKQIVTFLNNLITSKEGSTAEKSEANVQSIMEKIADFIDRVSRVANNIDESEKTIQFLPKKIQIEKIEKRMERIKASVPQYEEKPTLHKVEVNEDGNSLKFEFEEFNGEEPTACASIPLYVFIDFVNSFCENDVEDRIIKLMQDKSIITVDAENVVVIDTAHTLENKEFKKENLLKRNFENVYFTGNAKKLLSKKFINN